MMKFLNRLFGSRNTKKRKATSKPRARTNAQTYELSPEEQRKQYIQKVIANLSAIHKLKEKQVEIRNAAYEELANMGTEAEIAIPQLIRKIFNKNANERLLARETLSKIDTNWIKNNRTLEELPFLIKQLEKEQTSANKAIGVLTKMGTPTVERLVQILKDDSLENGYLKTNIIKVLSDIEPVSHELKPCLIDILHKSDHSSLIEISYEKLSDLGGTDDKHIKTFIERHGNDTQHIKTNLIDVIQAGKNISQESIAYLFKSLADKYENVRAISIETLAQLDSQIADNFYYEIINAMGSPTHDDIKVVFDKVNFWTGTGVETYRLDGAKIWSNLSWYYLELQEDLNRPTTLLNSVLKIFHTKKQCREDLIDQLMDAYDIYQRDDVRINIVKVLSEATLQKEKITTFLLNKLPKAPDEVSAVIIESLNKIDRKWIAQKHGIQTVNAIIDKLEGNHKDQSIIVLNELGESIIPQLNERLAQAKTRYMLQTIIEVLENFHKGSVTTLPILHKLQKNTTNLNTLKAIERLVEKINTDNN